MSEEKELTEAQVIAAKEAELQIERQRMIAKTAYLQLKKKLKPQSKNQLIKIIIDQVSARQELQAIAQQLLTENKKLKGESDETNSPTSHASNDNSDS